MGSTPFCAQYYDLFGPELFVVVAWGAGKKDAIDGVDSRGRDFTRSARRLLKRDSTPPLNFSVVPRKVSGGPQSLAGSPVKSADHEPGHMGG